MFLACISDAQANVAGGIAAVYRAENDTVHIQGWTCQRGGLKPASVRIILGNTASSDVPLFSTLADRKLFPKQGKCDPASDGHGFQITLNGRDAVRFAGQKVYAYTVQQEDNPKTTELDGSGTFSIPLSREYERVDCKSWNGVVDRDIQLQPPNCLVATQVVFAKPDLRLDCNGGTIDGKNWIPLPGSRGQGIGVANAKDACERSKLVGDASRFFDADASGSLIENCKISNFSFGIYFNRRAWTKPHPNSECVPYPEYSDVNARKLDGRDLNGLLGGRERRYDYSTADVTIRNVVSTNARDSGIFVNEYASNWLIDGATVVGNSVGIYLERESRQNRIIASVIANNKNVGIAIDASANNLIEKNRIEKNGTIGVALYKNCGEAGGVTRYQHSDGNILRHNIIRGQGGTPLNNMTLTTSYLLSLPGASKISNPGVGVWIASRQGLSQTWMSSTKRNERAACSDPGYGVHGETFYTDHANNNQLIENTIDNNNLAGVIIEDDNNKLVRNNLSSSSNSRAFAGIIIGSIFRQQNPSLGPVKNITLSGNVLPDETIGDAVVWIGGSAREN